jgi:hypothetical protein
MNSEKPTEMAQIGARPRIDEDDSEKEKERYRNIEIKK